MRHLITEEILENLDAPENDRGRAVESHLSECSQCAELKQELQTLVLRIQADASFEPPADLLEWGVSLFQPLIQVTSKSASSGTGEKLRKMIATLVFDTFDHPLQAGVRRVGAPSRQLLFRAGDVDVDVKIESKETNNHITLFGQVLSSEAKFFDNTPVKLESHGIVRYRTTTNPVGEFSFDEVPKDTYHLSVDLPEGQIMLFCVHRGNS